MALRWVSRRPDEPGGFGEDPVMKAKHRWTARLCVRRIFPFPTEWKRREGRRGRVIQPGGSVRDNDVIAAADGWYGDGIYRMRHFLH